MAVTTLVDSYVFEQDSLFRLSEESKTMEIV